MAVGFAPHGQTHVQAQTAIDWAALGPSVAQRDARLKAVCRFVRHIQIEDARHELPPANHFGARKRRRTPYIYSADERCALPLCVVPLAYLVAHRVSEPQAKFVSLILLNNIIDRPSTRSWSRPSSLVRWCRH